MVFNKNYAIGLILLVFSLPVLLAACSSNDTLRKPTPPAHLVSTLAPGNGGGTGRIALACAPDPAQNKPDICVSNLDGSGLRRLTSGQGPTSPPPGPLTASASSFEPLMLTFLKPATSGS